MMRTLVAAFAALMLSHSVHANELQIAASKALAAGEPAAVMKAMDKEIYRGNIAAAYQLGLIYHEGKLVTRDDAKARKFLKMAAERSDIRLWFKLGIADAQYALGTMLRDGHGSKPDPAAAASWFEMAAQQGHTQAQLALAQIDFKTAGGKPNPERAFIWSSIAEKSLSDAAQKEAEQIRDAARKQLEPKRLASAEALISTWTPRTY